MRAAPLQRKCLDASSSVRRRWLCFVAQTPKNLKPYISFDNDWTWGFHSNVAFHQRQETQFYSRALSSYL